MSENIKNEEYNPDLISLTDDEGKEYHFEVLDAIETDTSRYLALLPQYSDPQAMLDDSGELVIVKVEEGTARNFSAKSKTMTNMKWLPTLLLTVSKICLK